MEEDDDLQALRLAALQTIRPRIPREKAGISNSKNQTDSAAFFRPVSNPNLIAIVPVDTENKTSNEKRKLVHATVPKNEDKKPVVHASVPKNEDKKPVAPAAFGSDAKKLQTEKVETKFSRFRDSESDSDDDSIDGNITFRNDRIKENVVEKRQDTIESDDDCLDLRDEDDDSLEKLMDQMEKEFNGTESGSQKDQPSKSKVDSNQLTSNENGKEKEMHSTIKDSKVASDTKVDDYKRISTSPPRNPPSRKKSPLRTSPKIYSEVSSKDSYKRNRSPVHPAKRSPYRRSRSPIRSKSRSPRRYGRRLSTSPRRRSITPRRKRSLSRSLSPLCRLDRPSPKRRFRPSKRRSNSPWKKSLSPRRSFSPRRKSVSPRKKSVSPKRTSLTLSSLSPRRRSFSPRMKSPSPRRRGYSPRRMSLSPRQRKISPSYTNGVNSPKRSGNNYSSYSLKSPSYSRDSSSYLSPPRGSYCPSSPSYRRSPLHSRSYEGSLYISNVPNNCPVSNSHNFQPSSYESNKYPQSRKRSSSQGRKSFSPVRKCSPKHRRKSPRKSVSPRDFNPFKRRSRSPRSPRRSVSPKQHQHKAMSPRRKSPVRRRSASPRRTVRKSPLRSQAWSPSRTRLSPEGKSRSRKIADVPKRSPVNSTETRGKERIDRSVKAAKLAKGNTGKPIEENKNKEQKRKDEKKVPEPPKSDVPPDPVLEARRKKFESNSLVAPTNKKIRLGPVINRVIIKESSVNDEKNKGKSPEIKTVNNLVKNIPRESENDSHNLDYSGDVLLLDTDYNLDELDDPKETVHVIEPALEKTRKLEVQTSVPPKRQLKKRAVNEEPLVVQKRKISVNIKPTALKALEEKSKKISEHKLIQENKDAPTKKSVTEKSVVSCKNSENSTNKRLSHRQVKNSKEAAVENKEERSESTTDSKGIDLRAELSRRRAERLKIGPKLVPITRLLQSAFEGVAANKTIRVNRSSETVASVKKKHVPASKGRRVQVVQMKRMDRALESGPQESDSDGSVEDLQRNSCSHLNSQSSGRSVLHRNQV